MKYLFTALTFLPLFCFSNPYHPGGDTSQTFYNKFSFALEAKNLPLEAKLDFAVGNGFFKNPWIPAPATTTARDGLGPLFNTNGCEKCHVRDGRGQKLTQDGIQKVSTLVRLSIPPITPEQILLQSLYGPIGDPIYGGQFQPLSTTNVSAEGNVVVRWHSKVTELNDGTNVTLQWPEISLKNLQYGDLNPKTVLSARIAPAMIGLGLLEQIDEQDIINNQKQQALRKDNIKGQISWVWDKIKQQTVLGKFGWKAAQPSVSQQNAAAFHGDLGLTSSLFDSAPCTSFQIKCLEAPNGGEHEVSDKILIFVEHYARHLNVPKRTKLEKQGEVIFKQAKCDICHKPSYITQENKYLPALSKQTIYPYTDMLLHDLGSGLTSNQEFTASTQQWRTPPLWGLGKHEQVTGELSLLHDGRASSMLQAILWHGGEAQESVNIVKALKTEQRTLLISFLESL
ncbi:MAG: thiol oxidoreductase [Saccharospirillaceae bacterium]|nr:thiol oxidoreductase [Pseudomonadales bacterium]NRB80297.1 thiol oxidoreductase [Saccharospirillaceae bacterium]